MAVLKVSNDVSEAAMERIEAIVEKTLNYDPDWSGAEIVIKRDDCTCVECSDEVAGSQLLAKVNRAIDGADHATT
jgi:hypothetical protein